MQLQEHADTEVLSTRVVLLGDARVGKSCVSAALLGLEAELAVDQHCRSAAPRPLPLVC